MIKSKDSTYFISDKPNSTPTSTLISDISIFPTVQSNLAPSNIPSPVPLFERSSLPNPPPGLFPYDVPSDLTRLRPSLLPIFETNDIIISLPSLSKYFAPSSEASTYTHSIISEKTSETTSDMTSIVLSRSQMKLSFMT